MYLIVFMHRYDQSVDLQQLRYVLAIAETHSFTRAAARCFVAQSALSHQIASLERELGFRLFARTSRRVEPTAAGLAFFPAARSCLEAADRAVMDAAAAVGEIRGPLTIGTISTVAAVDIPTLLRRFRQQHPQVRVHLRVGSSYELTAAVRSGDVDVAFLGLPSHETPIGVNHQVLAEDRHVVVVAAGHPLADQRQVTLATLAAEPFADFTSGSPGRAQTDRAFQRAGVSRDVQFECGSVELLLGLVGANLGIALLPSAIAPPAGNGVATVEVSDGPDRVEHVIWSRINPSPAAYELLKIAGVAVGQPSPATAASPRR